jgi:hypothetical protein
VVDGERAALTTNYLDDRGERQVMVQGRNGRLEFWLRRNPSGWAFERFSRQPGGISKHIEAFFTYFSATYSVKHQPLRELILRPDYRIRVTRQGRREYKVEGSRSDRDSDGLLDFTATVRIAKSYPYAYVVAATYENTEPNRHDHDEVENTAREDPDGPRLTASASRHVATVGAVVYRYQAQVTYKYKPGLPEEAKSEFELSHYGLEDPPGLLDAGASAGLEPEPGRSQLYWLIVLMLGGVTLFLSGKYLLSPKRPAPGDRGGPTLPPPTSPS